MSGRTARAALLVAVQRRPPGIDFAVLTRRAARLRMHGGQIAFPGGRHDPGRDASLLATALREAREEVGLDEAEVTLLGALPERRTVSSSYLVSPFVARVRSLRPLDPDSREVARVFAVPLGKFADPGGRELVDWRHDGRIHRVPAVRVEGELVWGLTLDVIDDLLASGLHRIE
jgi:8-oxo-dGTP pyrophosphatase MutT (NUDIX family)